MMHRDFLKNKAKHSIAGLTLVCSMTPCAVAQSQTESHDEPQVKQELVPDTVDTDNTKTARTYLGFSAHNVIGMQTTGKEINLLDRATLGVNAGFEKNTWHGDMFVAGDFKLHNRDVSAQLSQATAKLGKEISEKSEIGLTAGREYTERNLFDGKTRFVDYSVADIYRDLYGNLSDKFALYYKTRKGLLIEAGVIEKADNSFYFAPNFKNIDFLGKVAFETKTKQNINIVGSGTIQLGKHERKIMGNFGVTGSNFGVMLGANYDANNAGLGFLVSGNYLSKRDYRYILSVAKYYFIYVVQAGIEKNNVMFFVTVNAAQNYSSFNAGLSWTLDYKQKIR